MGLWRTHIEPRMVDLACGAGLVRRQRRLVTPHAEGRVLEVGFGSGRNLPFYDPSKVSHLFALEPDAHMRALAADRVSASPLEITFLDLPGEEVPLEDASVDTVLVTYALCTIPDAAAAAAQMRRVLKPGGKVLFAEHGRAPGAATRFVQRAVEPVWSAMGGGCKLTRRPPDIFEAAGFTVAGEEAFAPGAPLENTLLRFAAYQYWGAAVPR